MVIITNLHDNVPLSLLFDQFLWLGRNPSNNFVAFLENLRHHNFVLILSDLYPLTICLFFAQNYSVLCEIELYLKPL